MDIVNHLQNQFESFEDEQHRFEKPSELFYEKIMEYNIYKKKQKNNKNREKYKAIHYLPLPR